MSHLRIPPSGGLFDRDTVLGCLSVYETTCSYYRLRTLNPGYPDRYHLYKVYHKEVINNEWIYCFRYIDVNHDGER